MDGGRRERAPHILCLQSKSREEVMAGVAHCDYSSLLMRAAVAVLNNLNRPISFNGCVFTVGPL